MIQFMTIESLATCILVAFVFAKWRWNTGGEIERFCGVARTVCLAGPNLDRLSSERASVPVTRFFIEFMGRARSLDELSGESDMPIEGMGRRVDGSEHLLISGRRKMCIQIFYA